MSQEVADWSLKRVVESILFASQRPVSTKDLHGIFKSAAEMEKADPHAASFSAIKESALRAAIDELGWGGGQWLSRRIARDRGRLATSHQTAVFAMASTAVSGVPFCSTERPCDGDSRDHRLQTADHTR